LLSTLNLCRYSTAANKEKERELDAAAALALCPKKEGKEGPESMEGDNKEEGADKKK
jgi:hypothetical protein